MMSDETSHVSDAGNDRFSFRSRAYTSNVCDATGSPDRATGEEHGARAAPSREHRNETPASVSEKANETSRPLRAGGVEVNDGVAGNRSEIVQSHRSGADVPPGPSPITARV